MQERKRIEQELATLALAVGEKSNEEATAALWDLYTQFAILTAEDRVRQQISAQQDSLQAQLQARLNALQNELAQTPQVENTAPVAERTTQVDTVPAEEELATDSPEPVAQEVTDKAPQAIVEPAAQEVTEVAPELFEEPVVQKTPQEPVVEKAPKVTEAPEIRAEEAEVSPNVVERAQQSGEKKSLNDRFAQKALSFGLNDRIGFTKALFEGSSEDFNRVVSQLNTMNTLSEAEDFLDTHIAPEYGWESQEEVAERFKAAVSQRFS